MLVENRAVLLTLRDEVIARKTIEAKSLKEMFPKMGAEEAAPADEAVKEEKKPRSREKAKSE